MSRENIEAKANEEKPIRPIRQRSIDRLARETMAVLAREKVFAKRVRWEYAPSIARLMNLADSLSNIADGIKPTCQTEYAIRHLLNTLTISVLKALDAKMTQAVRTLGTNMDLLKEWANCHKAAIGSMHRQINRDKKTYIPVYGEPILPDIELIKTMLLIFGTCSI